MTSPNTTAIPIVGLWLFAWSHFLHALPDLIQHHRKISHGFMRRFDEQCRNAAHTPSYQLEKK